MSGIPLPVSNIEWACNGIEQRGELSGGIKYFKHGYGCAVHLKSGAVDFDFGENGQVNGFNSSRLWSYANNINERHGFNSESEIAQQMKFAERENDIEYSGYILYYMPCNA